jgi:hypothetical protein
MADDDVSTAPCDWAHQITPPPISPVGKAIKPATTVLACRRNCGRFSEPLSGNTFDRAGKKVKDDDTTCPKTTDVDDDQQGPAKRRQIAKGASATTAASLGVMVTQVRALPWYLSKDTWRRYLELIIAPSTAHRLAASTAIRAMRREQTASGAGAAATPARNTTNKEDRFHEILRSSSPFDTEDFLPLAAAIASFLAAVDRNATAPPADRITVARDKLRKDEPGTALQLQTVIGIHTAKSLIDHGKHWFRRLVDKLILDHQGDPVHFVKSKTGKPITKETKAVVWPLQWATTLAKSWQMYLQALPVDAPVPLMFESLMTDSETPLLVTATEHNLTPTLMQGGVLDAAVTCAPHEAEPAASKTAFERHLRHNALTWYSKVVDTRSMRDDYKAAIKLGASLVGAKATPNPTNPTPNPQKPPHKPPPGTPQSPAVATPVSTATPTHTPPARPSAVIPLPPAPGMAATSGALTKADSTTAGSAGASPGKPTFFKCMVPSCIRAPPAGRPSFAPFCKACSPAWTYNWVTGAVTPRP